MSDEYIPISDFTNNIQSISNNELNLYFDSFDNIFEDEHNIYQIIPDDIYSTVQIKRVGYYVKSLNVLLKRFEFDSNTYLLYSCLYQKKDLSNRLTLLKLESNNNRFEIDFITQKIIIDEVLYGFYEIRKNKQKITEIKINKFNLIEKFIEICLENI